MFFKNLFGGQEERIEVDFSRLQLIPPDIRYWRSFQSSYKAYRAHKVEDFAYPKVDTLEDFRRFMIYADENRRGVNIQRGYVPTSLFWLTDGTNYLGSGSVRHYLNDRLKVFGGHVGYSIRPEAWGMGLGTAQLAFLLDEAAKLGIAKARLTCYETNLASQSVMKKNGARLVGRVINRISGKDRPTLIYEIDLTNK